MTQHKRAIANTYGIQSTCLRMGRSPLLWRSSAVHAATQQPTTAAVARYHHTTQSDGLHTRNKNRTSRRDRWPIGNSVSSVAPAARRTLRGAYRGPPSAVKLYSSACSVCW